MIQIIKGTFGYYNGRKVIPITEADGPQKFDDELEARLVRKASPSTSASRARLPSSPHPLPATTPTSLPAPTPRPTRPMSTTRT